MNRSPAPAVAVVVPAWNEEARLPRLLDALASCRPAPAEIVVADGGSTDGTRDLARARARLVDAPRGRGSQMNVGAAATTSEVLWFLHADSVPPPAAVDEIRRAVAGGAPGGAFRIVFLPDEVGASRLLRIVEAGIDARTRITRTATGDQGIFARRSVFERLGGFPDWPLFEDVAFFAALRRVGRPALCGGPLVTSGRRWIEGGVARTMGRMWALRVAYALGVSPARLARWWRHQPAS